MYWLALHAWFTERGAARVVVLNPLQTVPSETRPCAGVRPTASTRSPSRSSSGGWARRPPGHVRPDERQAAARDVSRRLRPSRTEMVELRARQLVKLSGVLDRLFPEFRAAFGQLPDASSGARVRSPCSPAGHRRQC